LISAAALRNLGDRFDLTLTSVTDPTFLTAGDNLFGYSFGDWVDVGNKVQGFTTQDLGEYILFLRDGVKTAGMFYLVPNSFRSHAPLRACCLQSLSKKLQSLLPDATKWCYVVYNQGGSSSLLEGALRCATWCPYMSS
jgi:hypothetical protein